MTIAAQALRDGLGTLEAVLLAERALSERLRQIIQELQRHRFGPASADRAPRACPRTSSSWRSRRQSRSRPRAGPNAPRAGGGAPREPAARRRTNLGALPAHLSRVETVVDVASTGCPCCAGPLHRINEDVAERLDLVPARFRILVVREPKYGQPKYGQPKYGQPKYGCRACQDVAVPAPAPARLVEAACRPTRPWRTSWAPSTRIIFLSTARRRSTPGSPGSPRRS